MNLKPVPPRQAAGFSLLEILVAFAILSVSLGIVLKIFSGGANTAAVAEEYTVAVQLAESLMVRAGVETPLQAGQVEGKDEDKYAWLLTVSPYPFNPEAVDAKTLTTELFKVDVTVTWDEDTGSGKRLELTTLKLRNKKETP